MKKLAGIALLLVMMGGSAYASSLSFSPEEASFGRGCDVYVDILVNAKEDIVASDIIIETSLEYKAFIPNTNYFPYFFPPKVSNDGLIHIVGFSTYYPVQGEGRLGTLVLSSTPTDSDGVLKYFFTGKGKTNTIDSNLSRAGGTDTLSNVGKAYYVFADTSCADTTFTGVFGNENVEEYLRALIETINQDGLIQQDSVVHGAAPEVQMPFETAKQLNILALLSGDLLAYKFILLAVLLFFVLILTVRMLRRKRKEPLLPPNPPAVGV